MTYLERSVHLRSNSLSQSLTALPAPSEREPLARPEDLHFNRKLYRHAKGPIPEGAGIERSEMTGGVSSAAKFPHAKTARPPRVRGSLAGSSFYGLHACRVFHGGFTAGFVRQALHAAGVRGLDRQGEHESAPLALLALDADLTAGEVDQHLADVQAEACAPGMKRLPDESGLPGAVEDPASMKPVD